MLSSSWLSASVEYPGPGYSTDHLNYRRPNEVEFAPCRDREESRIMLSSYWFSASVSYPAPASPTDHLTHSLPYYTAFATCVELADSLTL